MREIVEIYRREVNFTGRKYGRNNIKIIKNHRKKT